MFEGSELVEHWRFSTARESTSDQLGAALSDLLALRGFSFQSVKSSIVSTTVPELAAQWEHVAERYLGHRMVVVGPGLKTQMPIRVDSPQELGADRLVNAVAAYHQFQKACIVVDFGTAITFDVVSAKGEYLGGAIAPGIEVSMEALTARAAKLPRVDLQEPSSVIGKSTAEAIRSGVIYGFSGQVDSVLKRMRKELGSDVIAIGTGGLAETVVSHCELIDTSDDLLTLKGLYLLHELNS